MSEWQLIKTLQPEEGERYLLVATRSSKLFPSPEQIVGMYSRGWWSGRDTLSHVTHWLPLLDLPK